MVSGQFVDVPSSVSTPLSLDLSKSSSTSNLNSSSAVSSFGAASSSSVLNSTSVASSGTTLSSSFYSTSTSIPSFSSMAAPSMFFPTTATSTDPTSLSLSSTSSSPSFFPNNGFSSSPAPSQSLQTGSSSLTKPTSATNSESAPGSTDSETTETPVQNTSEPGSTITSVIVVSTTSSTWDTVTTQPTSTLSTAVVLTTTNSMGSQVKTTPPLVTLLSTSTDGNGVLFTATAVVANPPQADLRSGILHNTGAVAAIFSVVGVVFASLVACLVIYVRRRRKVHQREEWLAGVEVQQLRSSFADDPFRDQSLPPAMRNVHTDAEDVPWNRRGFLTSEDSNHSHLTFGETKASIFPVYPISRDASGTFNQPVDMASPAEFNKARFSIVSSPSIYPDDEDKDIVMVPNFNQIATTSNLPPRPPRSHLRDSDRGTNVFSSILPTPPESESSNHTNIVSKPRSRDYIFNVIDRKPF